MRSVLHNERGIALVAALMLMVAITALLTAASMTTVTEKAVTVSHRVGGRALYSADAGVEVAKQIMTDWATGQMDSLNSVWDGNGPIIPDPQGLFPNQGLIMDYDGPPAFQTVTTLAFQDSSLNLQSQAYDYLYTTTATGTYAEGERRVVSQGKLRVSATRGSFADYLLFTDTHLTPDGYDIWFHTSGYFDGRVHTNGTMRFAYYPTFEDFTTQVNDEAGFYNNGNVTYLDADRNGNKDVPNFYGGFERSSPNIELPDNAFSQQRAAIGGNPASTSTVTNGELRAHLGLPPGSTAPPTGVYLPNNGGLVTGGIYVQGNSNHTELSVDGSGRQVYTIQDKNGQTSTIKVDRTTNTTEYTPYGQASQTLAGTPNGVLFVNGKIQTLTGPGRVGGDPLPAVADGSQLTVVSNGDINLEGDLTYNDMDGGNSVLGLFTPGGDVRITSNAPDEIRMDGFVMAAGDGKAWVVDGYDSGDYRGQVHLRGGMITNHYGAFGTFGNNGSMTGYGRDFHYDPRGIVPPYFPLTQRFVTDQPIPRVLAWREDH